MKRQAIGKWNDAVDRGENIAGLATVAHGSNDALADLKTGHTGTNGINDPTGFVTGGEREGWAGLIEPHSHE